MPPSKLLLYSIYSTNHSNFEYFCGTAICLTAIYRPGIISPMKAMILAAGLGTRLLPLTKHKPKPLFPILGQPLIDILIRTLKDSGCEAVVINTHHLANMVEEFVGAQSYGIPVMTCYEPTILGTGGGIKNVEDFWKNEPLLVINSDIFTNIDLEEVWRFHLNHSHPVTLVLHDYQQFNNVLVDSSDHVSAFYDAKHLLPGLRQPSQPQSSQLTAHAEDSDLRVLAFTGIHVVDPKVLDFIPRAEFYSIIDVYSEMISQGIAPKAFVARDHFWHDIGTMPGYLASVKEAMARNALKRAFPEVKEGLLVWSKLKGDGSDRAWFRVSLDKSSVILADHGPPKDGTCDADSFCAIGRHLYSRGIPVPQIHGYDRPSGLVAVEDLGDLHLQTLVVRTRDPAKVASYYRAVIDLLITMGIEGAKGFDPAYTCETPNYDQDLIIEREAKYFVTAFLNEYKGLDIDFEDLKEECELLARSALETSNIGFLHRDFQSRNILVRNQDYYFIDFQGARLGPLQYDLASLLIDPYVKHPRSLQHDLLEYYLGRLQDFVSIDKASFVRAYNYCAINRNLQILGAFAFLSQEKGKKDFEAYIPQAVVTLQQNLQGLKPHACKRLRQIVEQL